MLYHGQACKPPLEGRGVRNEFEHACLLLSCRADVGFIISAHLSSCETAYSSPAATASIKNEAVVDDLRRRQTLCTLHHMRGIDADRCCRVNAPVGRLGPCSDANQDQSSYENAELTHLNSPVVGLTAYP